MLVRKISLTSWDPGCKSHDKESIAFIGDDLNDKTIMEYVGMAACPQDAVEEIKLLVDVVLSKKGKAASGSY